MAAKAKKTLKDRIAELTAKQAIADKKTELKTRIDKDKAELAKLRKRK